MGAGAGSQSRATDTHLILRQHEEDGVIVLDAAVRSWKPIDPVCLRWEFPAWHIDTDLDPTQLRKANRKIKRDEIASAPDESKIVWTVEKFVESFLSADALAANIIVAKACAVMSERKAIKWLTLAEHERRIHRWTPANPRNPVQYATIEQPVTATGEPPK